MSLGLFDGIAGLANTVISRIWPDKTEQEKEVFALEFQKALADSESIKGQLSINAAEAANPNLFVAGWRPAVGWICALSFAWQFVVLPILLFIGNATGHVVDVPVFDTTTMIGMLGGMLGFGTLRTAEKISKDRSAQDDD